MRLKDIIEATMSLQDDQFKETMNLSNIKFFRKSIKSKPINH